MDLTTKDILNAKNMKEQQFYTSFSQRRRELRSEWNKLLITPDWEQYVELAELRALRVYDALNKSIDTFTHKEITDAYMSLYRPEAIEMHNKTFNVI